MSPVETSNSHNKSDLLAFLSYNKSLKIAVILHIENFLKLVTAYGTDFGSDIIMELSKRLSSVFDKNEIYKLKTSEFLLCSEVSMEKVEDEIEKTKTLVLSLLTKNFYISGIELNIKTHIGFATASGVDILRYADLALEEAKRTNKVACVFSESLLNNKPSTENNLSILKQIQRAIRNKEIIAHYQPIINNKTGKCYKYEALLRVKGSDGNFISPGHFLELTKISNDYPEITKAIIERVLEDFASRPGDKVSINLTFSDIVCPAIRNFIKNKLRFFPYPQNIIFEIVESEEVYDFEMLNQFIKELKNVNSNIGIAIDDFGTGFSNYLNLSSICADFIKIDGELIKNIQSPRTYDIIKSICDFAKSNNIEIIAEYVETKEIYELVKELGIEYSQGYYFSKPLEFNKLNKRNIEMRIKIIIMNTKPDGLVSGTFNIETYDKTFVEELQKYACPFRLSHFLSEEENKGFKKLNVPLENEDEYDLVIDFSEVTEKIINEKVEKGELFSIIPDAYIKSTNHLDKYGK